MKYTTEIKVKKNGYYPSKGLYRLVFPYISTLKKVKFEMKDGQLGTYHKDLFYPMDSIFWAEDGVEMSLKAFHKTEIGEKLQRDNIVVELDDYFIISDTEEFKGAEG